MSGVSLLLLIQLYCNTVYTFDASSIILGIRGPERIIHTYMPFQQHKQQYMHISTHSFRNNICCIMNGIQSVLRTTLCCSSSSSIRMHNTCPGFSLVEVILFFNYKLLKFYYHSSEKSSPASTYINSSEKKKPGACSILWTTGAMISLISAWGTRPLERDQDSPVQAEHKVVFFQVSML